MPDKKIVIVSSGQPSANPRAVKEAVLLSRNNYQVSFIYCPLSPWADEFDKKLFSDVPEIKWISVGSHPNRQKLFYRYARWRRKFFQKLNGISSNIFGSALKSYVLFSQELEKEALKHKADLYIGHNLGSIKAVVKAAEKYKALSRFDAEDFHRGEFTDDDPAAKTAAAIENSFFPQIDSFTTAAPLISEAYTKIFPQKLFQTINNVFSLEYLSKKQIEAVRSGIDLFWFSQFIGTSRGLETVIAAINKCSDLEIRLHLMGNVKDEYRSMLENSIHQKDRLFFIQPANLSEIFSVSANFDIGLGTEEPRTHNREYCLTNKLFTYLLSGNCLLVSGTAAQKKMMEDYPGTGEVYVPYNADDLAKAMRRLYQDRSLLNKYREQSLTIAGEELNWEKEGEKFLSGIRQIFNQ